MEEEVFSGKLQEFGILTLAQPYEQHTNADHSQVLILDNKGNVFFERTPSWHSEKSDVKKMKISGEDAEKIFQSISEYFKEPHECFIIPDLGYWEIILKNDEGKEFKFSNCMSGLVASFKKDSTETRTKNDSELREMTKLIKSILKDDSVIAFGGCMSMYKF